MTLRGIARAVLVFVCLSIVASLLLLGGSSSAWQANGPVPGDYTTFAHLFDSSGVKVTQADAPPREGYWPTSRWRPSEPVTSTLAIELPPNLPPGQYVLGVGMYDPVSGQRLFAYKPDGSEWRDWVIALEPELALP